MVIAVNTLIWALLFAIVVFGIYQTRTMGIKTRAVETYRGSTYLSWGIIGFLFVSLVYHGVAEPGISAFGDWTYLGPTHSLATVATSPSAWSYANLGTNNIVGFATYPLYALEALFARAGLSTGIDQKITFQIPILVVAYSGIIVMLRNFRVYPVVAALLGVFYTCNSFFLDWYSGGWLPILVGFAILPWIVTVASNLLSAGPSWTRVVMLAILINLAVAGDPRQAAEMFGAAAVLGIVLIIIGWRPVWQLRRASMLLLIVPLSIGLQADWLLPIAAGVHPTLPAGYTTVNALSEFSYMGLGNALTGFDLWWPSMHYFTVESTMPWFAYSVPLLAIAGVWHNRRQVEILAAGAVLCAYSVLVAGTNLPFRAIAEWAFITIPGDNLFRYPALFEEMVLLCLVILISKGMQSIASYVSGSSRSWRQIIVTCGIPLFVLYVGFISAPGVSGSLGHMLRPVKTPTPAELAQATVNTLPDGSVVWIPAIPPTAVQGVVTGAGAKHPPISAAALPSLVYPQEYEGGGQLAWLENTSTVLSYVRELHIVYFAVATNSWKSIYSGRHALDEKKSILERISEIFGTPIRKSNGFIIYKAKGEQLISVNAVTIHSGPTFRQPVKTSDSQVFSYLQAPPQGVMVMRIGGSSLQLMLNYNSTLRWYTVCSWQKAVPSRVTIAAEGHSETVPANSLKRKGGVLVGTINRPLHPIPVKFGVSFTTTAAAVTPHHTERSPTLARSLVQSPMDRVVMISSLQVPGVNSVPKNIDVVNADGFTRNGVVFKFNSSHWSEVGNGDNYDHLSLRKAGISLSSTNDGVLRFTVRRGGAVIGTQWTPWGWSAQYEVSMRYKGTVGSYLVVSVFPPGSGSLPANVYFPVKRPGWNTITENLLVPPSNNVGPDQLDISAYPATQGIASVASVAEISIREPFGRSGGHSSVPISGISQAGPASYAIGLPPSAGWDSIRLWQRFDPGWRAVCPRGVSCSHTEVRGWANGFLVGPHEGRITVSLEYDGQRGMAIGLHVAEAVYCVLILGVIAAATIRKLGLLGVGRGM